MAFFNIISEAIGPGVIDPSGTVVVLQGSDKTFTIGANPGKTFLDVLVDGVSVGAVPSYTFTNVQAHHTIEAQFADTPAAPGLDIESVWDRTKELLTPPTYVDLDGNPAPGVKTIVLTWADAIINAWKTGTTNIGHPCGPTPPYPHPATVLPVAFNLVAMSSYSLSMFNTGKYKDPKAKKWVVSPAIVPTSSGNMMRLTELVFSVFISNLSLVTGTPALDGCIPHIHTWDLSTGLSPAMFAQIIAGIPGAFGLPPTPAIIMLIDAFTKALQAEIIENGGTGFMFGAGHFHTLV